MNRHQNRENAVIALYQYLIFERDIEQLIEDLNDEYIVDVFKYTLVNIQTFKSDIDSKLDHWSFDRLGFVEQAILLLGYGEISKGEVEKPIIIDEYIEIAKKYGDADSYKIINGVMDKI